MDEKFTLHQAADLAIKGAKIVDLSPQTKYTGRKIIEARGKLVMPGLINTHTHAAMVMMRGLADDMPLDVWWQKFIFPIEKKLLDPEFITVGVGLAAVEMIKSGTTAFSDMYFFEDAAADICKKIGLRAFLGEGVLDFPSPDAQNAEETLKIIEGLHEKWGRDPLIHLEVASHAPYSCGRDNLLKSKALADKLNLPLHIHVSETAGEVAEFRQKHGLSPVEYLEKIGFLSDRVKAVHCVHLSHDDIKLLRRYDVRVAHCQESNMKLASGAAPIVELQDAGVVVGLGTDGAASNNNLDMFDEMDSVAKYHKAVRSDPTVMDARTVLKMATSDAAKVVFKEKELGSLEVGKTADVIIIDLDRPHLTPLYNICSHLVYSAGGSEVETAIINGRLVMENREILTVDEDEIIDRANWLAAKIKKEVGHG
jgi:5-methylthioadenosine/S-adenosylhomocysteine deaminase